MAPPVSTLDPDLQTAARLRGKIAAAGRTGDTETVRSHLTDPNPAVRATAYAALARAGAATSEDGAAAAADPSPAVRRRAAELAGEMPGVDHLELLGDPDDLVVEAAAFALGEVHAEATPAQSVIDELSRVAGNHTNPLCRESAVAALGSIGDERGLPAILTASGDKPAIRRRAVLALAPFEGTEVTAALERASEDRDWQVRQAAEDLLGYRRPADPR
jgi:HEAT repeat protein